MFENIDLNKAFNFILNVCFIGKCLNKPSPMAQTPLSKHPSINALANTRRGIRNESVVLMGRPVSPYAKAKCPENAVTFRRRSARGKDRGAVNK